MDLATDAKQLAIARELALADISRRAAPRPNQSSLELLISAGAEILTGLGYSDFVGFMTDHARRKVTEAQAHAIVQRLRQRLGQG